MPQCWLRWLSPLAFTFYKSCYHKTMGNTSLFNRVMGYFSSRRGANEIEAFANEARAFIQESKKSLDEIVRQRELLETMAHHMGGLVWIKKWDLEKLLYLYEFANRPHCERFFSLPDDCLESCNDHIQGRDDMEVLNEYRERTGKRNTFGDLCFSTDKHATEQAILYQNTGGKEGSRACTYLECGFIGDRQLILEVTKTSLFLPDKPATWQTHTFSVGSACDLSGQCDSSLERAYRYVANGEGTKLSPGVFWLYPKSETCHLLTGELSGER